MPKRTDIKKILIIGSGPIVIGQACEFDYSGTQACKALREEGYEVVLINSNPATIMTDPETAHRTYIEPITPEIVAKVIERERPDAVLPTLGGQTGLNTAVKVAETGLLEKLGVEMIGASIPVIQKAEDREKFRNAMSHIRLRVPKSGIARNMEDARAAAETIGYPLIIRASFTLGGIGSGIAYNREEFEVLASAGLDASMISEIIVEESLIGWKEFELEVMRDFKDNVVIICSIENFDPMGVHTGDSITVAPAQTLTDREYQTMRDAAIAIIREIGVETGGSNIQFAIHPDTGEMVVIEMNPRVSRSSALASKATGFPIAKIAAKLAVGYTLDEIANDITRETLASFEPTIDYCVVKIPRWTFEKFSRRRRQAHDLHEIRRRNHGHRPDLQGSPAKGCAVSGDRAIWPSWRFAQRARSISWTSGTSNRGFSIPTPNACFTCRSFLKGNPSGIYELTRIDPWFLHHIRQIVDIKTRVMAKRTFRGGLRKRTWPWKEVQGIRLFGRAAGPALGGDPTRRPDPKGAGLNRSTSWWIPALRSSRLTRPTTTPRTNRKTRFAAAIEKKWSSWEGVPTESDRGSSSITAASRLPLLSGRWGLRASW